MKAALFFAVLAFVLLSGCIQEALSEAVGCLQTCGNLCQLAKQSNLDLNGYNAIGLQKRVGGMKIECNCPCGG